MRVWRAIVVAWSVEDELRTFLVGNDVAIMTPASNILHPLPLSLLITQPWVRGVKTPFAADYDPPARL